MEALSNLFLESPEFIDRTMIEQVIEFASILIIFAQFLVSIVFSISTMMHIAHWALKIYDIVNAHEPKQKSSMPPRFLEVNFILPSLGSGTDSFLEYLPIFVVVSLIHEFGHYFASMMNSVRPLSVQFKFAYFVPLSSVTLNIETYSKLPKRKKLAILTNGIFANFVLSSILHVVIVLVAYFGIYDSKGVYVSELRDYDHPIIGHPGVNGLKLDDRIEKINGCPTDNVVMFYQCLYEITLSSPIGVCVHERLNFDVDFGPPLEPQSFLMPFSINVSPEVPKCPHRYEIYVYNSTNRRYRTCVHLRRIIRLEQKKRGMPLRYCRQLDDCDKKAGEYCLIGDADYAAHAAATNIKEGHVEKFCIYYIEMNSDSNQMIIFVGVTSDFFEPFFVMQKNSLLTFLSKFYDVTLSFGFFNLLPCFNFDGYWLLVELVGLLSLSDNGKIYLIRFVSRSIAFCVLLHLGLSLWWAEISNP